MAGYSPKFGMLCSGEYLQSTSKMIGQWTNSLDTCQLSELTLKHIITTPFKLFTPEWQITNSARMGPSCGQL